MYEKLLEECGLTKNEALAYLALLKLGKAKSGEIVREAEISGGKIYETLYKLIDKGLVKSVSENGIKKFIASDPKAIISYIKEKEKSLIEKEKELEKVLPSFSLLKNEDIENTVFFVKGLRGISPIVNQPLKTAKSIKIMGIRSSKQDVYNNFWRAWHLERVKLKRNAQILFSDKNTDYWKFFKKLKHTQVKEIISFSPSAIMIIDSEVFIFSYDEDLVCIHIKSNSISQSFSNFFDDLWKIH